MAYMHKMLKIW